jgi:KDO2-lipid IV(A) lauroyltransferase
MNFINSVSYYLLYGIAYLASLLPMTLLYGIAKVYYFLMYYIVSYRKSVVIQNLSRSFPEKKYNDIKRLTVRFYKSFTDNFVEILKTLSVSEIEQQKRLVLTNIELVENLINQGKSIIAGTGHCGNWEIFNIMPSMMKQIDCYAVYKPLRIQAFDRLFIKLRTRFGMKMVPAKSVARFFLKNKNTPSLYLFLADQSPKRPDAEYQCQFLHQKTYMFPGVEKLAKSTNAAVVYVHITERKHGFYYAEFKLISEDSASTKDMEITSKYAALLEQTIKELPHKWLWSHKRWKHI